MQSGCAKSRCVSCKSTRFDLQVDVVLSDDRGFWNAIETFMSISKRPIVMTASDRYFVSRFPCRVELLRLHTPQHVCSVDFLPLEYVFVISVTVVEHILCWKYPFNCWD